jgi:hypothetical protein
VTNSYDFNAPFDPYNENPLDTGRETEQEAFPEKTDDFLHWLHRQWPHRCPGVGLGLEGIHRYAGARSLIDMLMARQFGPDESKW